MRIAIGILDGLVHGDDPDQTHSLDLGVRKLIPDQARDLGVGLAQLPAVSILAYVLGDTILVVEEHALQNRHLVGDAVGGYEVPMAEHLFDTGTDAVALLIEVGDPLGTGLAVRGDGKVDDAVLLDPGASGLGDHQFVAQERLGTRDAAQLVENRLNKTELDVRVLHGGTHDKILSLTIGQNCSLA